MTRTYTMALHYIIVLLLFGSTSIQSSPTLTNGCPADYHIHRLLPHETDCDKFYQCSNGQKYLMQCGAGTLFDNKLQICNWPHAVECHLTTTTPSIEPTTEEATTLKLTTEDTQTTTEAAYTTVEETTAVHTTIDQTASDLTTETQTIVTQTSLEPTTEGSDAETETTTVRLTTEDLATEEILEQTTTASVTSMSTTITESTVKPTTVELNNTEGTTTWITESADKETTDGLVTIELSTIKSSTQEEPDITTEHTTEINDLTTINNIEDIGSSTNGATESTQNPDRSTTQEFITVTQISNYTTEESIITTQAPICPVGVFGNVPHPERCDAFFLCSGGIAFEVACSNGFEFDPVEKVCVEIAEGGCTLGSITDNETNNINSSTTALPTNTENITDESVTQETTYTPVQDLTTRPDNELLTEEVTENTRTTELSTDYPGIQDSTTQRYTTEETIMTTKAPICSAGVFGNIPHPERCDAYFLCSGGAAFEVTCSSGFEFDAVAKVCIEINEGGCTLGSVNDIVTENMGTSTTTELPINENITGESVTQEIFNTSVQDFTTIPSYELVTDETTKVTKTTELLTDYPGTQENTTDDDMDEITQDYIDVSTTDQISTSNTDLFPSSQSPNVSTDEPTTEAYTTDFQEPICSSGVFGNVPDPERCNAFYICSGGFSFQVFCSNGFEFDPESKECIEISVGGCTLGPVTTQENIEMFSTTIGNTNIKITTETHNEVTYTEIGTTDATLDVQAPDLSMPIQPPVNPDEGVTEETSTVDSGVTEPVCPAGVFGNIPHDSRCDAYYLCSAGMAFEVHCPSGFEYDPDLKNCVVIAEGGCTLNSNNFATIIMPVHEANTGQEMDRRENVCKRNLMGNVPHEQLCNSFYKCVDGDALQLFCSEGFEFEPRLKICIPIIDTGCTANKKNFSLGSQLGHLLHILYKIIKNK